jgi:hypothetical protein
VTGPVRQRLAAFALVVVVLAVAWMGRVSEGRKSLDASDAAFKRGDRVEAIILARAAAEARCPWCSAPELGFSRLYAIAKDGESRGDDATAVAAWRAVRAATLSTVLFDTSPARRERADAEIARLEHRIDAVATAAGAPPSPAASEERLRVALAKSAVPSGAVFALLAVGGALFLFGAVRFVRARSLRIGELAMAIAGGGIAAAGVLLF